MGDLLAHRGIAALLYDKRGTGASTGDWRSASFIDLAGDAAAAMDRLLEESDIDPSRVGLFGSSEAGYIVPMVAVARPLISLIVCRVCPAFPLGPQITGVPGESYERLDIPILVVLGELDEHIPVDPHRAAFLDYAGRAGNAEMEVEVMPEASHGLIEVRFGEDGERLPFDRFSPEFHTLVLDWIARHW